MKLKYLFLAVIAGAALVGCSKEQDKSAAEPASNGPSNYMGFTISMPSVTKAGAVGDPADPDYKPATGGTGTFVNGEDYENAIKSIHFFFYRNGAYVSWGYGDMKGKFNEDLTNTDDNIEEYMESTAAGKGVVVLESTMTIPNQVLCVINSRNPQWYRNKSLETVKAALHTGAVESLTGNVSIAATDGSFKDFQFEDGGNPYFVMFTSPMYGTKAGSTSEKEVKYVNDILVEETAPGSGIFTANSYIKNTRAEAENKPLTIYVERMAARFDIDNLKKLSEGGILKEDGTNFVHPDKMDKSLKVGNVATGAPIYDIEYLAWSVTAANKQAYSLKHIDSGWFDASASGTYGGWLRSGGSFENPVFSGENMFTRINWAMDPNYSTGDFAFTNRDVYPHSARELLMAVPQSAQKYWSATEVAANYAAADKSQLDILQRYSYENTFSKDGQASPRVNGTMLLLYAQVKKAGAADYENLYAYMGGELQTSQEYAQHLILTMDSHGYTFYINDSGFKPIHKEAAFGGALEKMSDPANKYFDVVKAAKILDFYGDNKASYANKSSELVNVGGVDTPILDVYPDMVVDLTGSLKAETFEPKFAVTWPIPAANVEKGYADGYVTLVPSSSMPKLYVEDTDVTTNSAYNGDPTSDTRFREASAKEIAEAFLNGVVEPANMYRDGKMYYAIPIEHYGQATDTTPEKKPLEGNYGVVRNNFYKVSIGTIKSLGHGIDDVNEPIVPGDREKPYYLAARINILSWQVAGQTANLEE